MTNKSDPGAAGVDLERRQDCSAGAAMRERAEHPRAEAAPRPAGPVAVRILVASASEPARQTRRDAMALLPVEVLEAGTGDEALRAIRQHEFAAILIDRDLPDMNGFELAALAWRERPVESTPVLFVLPDGDEREARTAYRMGAADCLTEPVDPEVLRQKLRVFVELEAYRAGLRATLEQTRAESRRLQDENRRLAERQEMLRHQSTHDPLTGLPNAALLEDRLDGALRRAARNRQRVAVVMVDFDGFRTVNDAHGPAAGDALLAAASRNLLQAVRASDTVARLGADRFVVVLEALHSATAAAQLGGKLAAAVAQPCTVRTSGRTIQLALAASLGVALGPDHGDQREDLLAAAEAAMYAARRDGDGVRMHAPAAAPTLALVGGLQAS